MELEKLKYPIGKFVYDPNSAAIMKNTWIRKIQNLPDKLERITNGLSPEQLNLIYRPGGWSIAQVVNHLADSHMNAYVRSKLALTEDHPKVIGYQEEMWAKTTDAVNINIQPSLQIIKGLHARWTQLWETMSADDFEKKYYHLGYKKDWTLMSVLCLYAWHSEHHLAHIHQAIKLNGKFA